MMTTIGPVRQTPTHARRRRPVLAVGACVMVLGATGTGCSRVDVVAQPTAEPMVLEQPSRTTDAPAVATSPVTPAAPPRTAVAGPAFSHPLATRSTYFPLVPGMRFSWEGTVTDAEGTHHHRVVTVVTDLVKKVDGVDARVILD